MSKQNEVKEGEIGGPRKVDQLVKKDSFADSLRKRRMDIENNPEGGMADASDARPGPDHYRGYTRQK